MTATLPPLAGPNRLMSRLRKIVAPLVASTVVLAAAAPVNVTVPRDWSRTRTVGSASSFASPVPE